MLNSYKNIIKNFAHKLNEQNEQAKPVHQPEEKVELTQAKAKHFDYETRSVYPNATPPATIELKTGKKLKFVSSLTDQVKGKVKQIPEDFEFISVYVDDSNKKYLVYDYDEFDRGPVADLAAESWVKRFESGALPPDEINPYLADIINDSKLLSFLGYNAAETIAKAIASLKLDAKQIKRTVEALWGNSNYSFKDIIKEIASMHGEFALSFLTSDPNGFHDTIKGYEDKTIGAMPYEFEV